jgi:iron(III) transport system ATP-binding protein
MKTDTSVNTNTVLRLHHVSHRYAASSERGHERHRVDPKRHQATFSALSFSLEKGQIGCLLGLSGCGKTTVLRCIAGFESLQEGEILINGQRVSSRDLTLPTEQRKIGMVFQDYALFPHLSIANNIGFGLHALTRAQRQARVDELLDVVGLSGFGNAYPHEVSGGQQQRVALARALAPKPELLLLDEPFSNLDVALRERLGIEVRDILKRENTTAILVTHDQHEAFAIADEIGVMHEGRIAQWDSAYQIYHEPANRFVADFVGEGVFLKGTVLANEHIDIGLGVIKGTIPADCPQGTSVDVLMRPDDIVHDDESPLQAKVLAKAFRGADFLYTLELSTGDQVLSLVPSHHNHAIGEKIGIQLEIDHVIAFAQPALP